MPKANGPKRRRAQNPLRPRGPGQLDPLTLEEMKDSMRADLLAMNDLANETRSQVHGLAAGHLGLINADAVIARNEVQNAVRQQLAPVADAAMVADTSIRSQAMGSLAGALELAQSVDPVYFRPEEIAATLIPGTTADTFLPHAAPVLAPDPAQMTLVVGTGTAPDNPPRYMLAATAVPVAPPVYSRIPDDGTYPPCTVPTPQGCYGLDDQGNLVPAGPGVPPLPVGTSPTAPALPVAPPIPTPPPTLPGVPIAPVAGVPTVPQVTGVLAPSRTFADHREACAAVAAEFNANGCNMAAAVAGVLGPPGSFVTIAGVEFGVGYIGGGEVNGQPWFKLWFFVRIPGSWPVVRTDMGFSVAYPGICQINCGGAIVPTPPIVAAPAYPPGYQPPTPPPTSPPVPPPSVPKVPECPPPKCIKICPDEPPPKCEPEKYCVWQDSDTKICYVAKEADKPRRSSDHKITCGDPAQWDLKNIFKLCCEVTTTPPTYQPGGGGLPGFGPVAGCQDLYRFRELLSNITPTMLGDIMKAAVAALPPMHGFGSELIDASATAVRDTLFQLSGQIFDGILNGLAKTNWLNCSGTAQESVIQMTRLVLGVVKKYVADIGESTEIPLMYAQNSLCPYIIPSVDQATSAWLGNTIDESRFRCIVEANGQRWDSWTQVADASRSKLAPGEYVAAFRRDFLNGTQYEQAMRSLGFTHPSDAALLNALFDQIPPATDLVSFMVRDVEDKNVYERFHLDDDFTEKFKGKVAEWARKQGVSEEYMLRIWRAHWAIPSPTALFEFWHKLRYEGKYGGPDKLREDITTALKQQDIAPFWVDHYLDSSYHPPTRVDARRMFNTGTMDEQDLFLAYVAQGYSDKNAKNLVEFSKKERAKAYQKNPYVKSYVKGVISRAELTTILSDALADPKTIDSVIATADKDREFLRRDVCHKAYRKRFLQGEFTTADVVAKLIQDGIDNGPATEIVAGWECEKISRGKTIPAATLCRWFTDGIITSADYYQRLLNLKYASDDALNIVTECEIVTARKRSQEDAKRMRQLEQLAKQAKSDAKAREAETQKRARTATANLNAARAIQKRRRGLVLEIAFQYAKTTGEEPGVAVDLVENVAKIISENGPYPIDSVLEAGTKVVKDVTVIDPDSLASVWSLTMLGLGSLASNP